MKLKTESTFKITGWDEETISEQEESGKLTRAHVTKSYQGGLQGDGVVEYVMAHKSDGSATFMGYEKVEASINDKSGSFVFEHRGEFKDGIVDSVWSIVEDSGTGELKGISGTVNFKAGHQDEYPITLDYEL